MTAASFSLPSWLPAHPTRQAERCGEERNIGNRRIHTILPLPVCVLSAQLPVPVPPSWSKLYI